MAVVAVAGGGLDGATGGVGAAGGAGGDTDDTDGGAVGAAGGEAGGAVGSAAATLPSADAIIWRSSAPSIRRMPAVSAKFLAACVKVLFVTTHPSEAA